MTYLQEMASRMAQFEISRDNGPRTCVVQLSGDVDMSVVPQLRQSLDGPLAEGCNRVVLNLADVTYVDSSALGLLVWLDHRLRPVEGRLVLAAPSRDVSRVLQLSGLVAVAVSVAVSPSVESAIEGLELPPTSGDPLWRQQIDVPIDVNKLGAVREAVCEIIFPLGFPDSALFDIKVALGEALANALRHGVGAKSDGEVQVHVVAYLDRVVIEVFDNGTGFDGTPTSSNDVYAVSGRGIMFMRALMDSVEFEPSPLGGTLVRITKHRPGCA